MTDSSDAGTAGGQASSGLLRNINLIFASNVTIAGFSFVIVVVIARLLGPEGRGIVSLFQTAVQLGFALGSLGVSVGVLYFVSRAEISPREASEAGLAVTLVAAAVTAAVVAVVVAVAPGELRRAGVPYWLLVLAIPAAVQFRLVESVLRSLGRFVAVGVLEVLVPLLLLGGLLAVEAGVGLSLAGALGVWTAANALPVLAGYAWLGPSGWPRTLVAPTVLRKVIKFGLAGQMGNLVQLFNYRVDSYIVLLFVNSAGVGLYSVGVAMSEGLWLLANSVAVVLVPHLTAADDAYVARTTPLVCRTTILVTALGAAAVAGLSPFLVPFLFGDAFRDAVRPFLFLLPGTVALAGSKVLAAYVFSRGRPGLNTAISGATFLVTIVADLALIPVLGVEGAAIASSLAYCLSLGLTSFAYRILSGQPAATALLPRPRDAALYVDGAHALLARLRRTAGATSRP